MYTNECEEIQFPPLISPTQENLLDAKHEQPHADSNLYSI